MIDGQAADIITAMQAARLSWDGEATGDHARVTVRRNGREVTATGSTMDEARARAWEKWQKPTEVTK